MHSLWLFFLRKRQFTWLFMASMIAAGAYSVYLIPKESAPEVIIPIGIVTTVYPGASALDVEELVTNKIENKVESLDGAEDVTSTSRDGISIVTVEFNAYADVNDSIDLVKDAVDIAKNDLPDDANEPQVIEVNFADQPIHMISVSSDLDPTSFTELGQKLEDEFKEVDGVSDVQVSGTRERQIQVTVDSASLSTFGISISDVVGSLQAANLSFPIGTVHTDGIEYAIRFEGNISDISSIKNIPVTAKGGFPIFIGDIATVTDGVSTESSISRVSVGNNPSEKALTLSVYKKSGYDVTKMSEGVHEKLSTLQAPGALLEDSQVLFIFDGGEQVDNDLRELIVAGAETVVLVMICLLLTIGWRESIVAALSIPLSFVIAFIGLLLSGNTINFISLFALILAVGILVDSGIVVTEAIHTRIRKYGNPNIAAEQAIKEYAWPLIGGTMTTIAVFAPLFFLSGVIGQFISSIPFTIIFVLLASIFVALGFVPLIALAITRSQPKGNRFEELQEEWTVKAQEWYKKKLIVFLSKPKMQRVFLWGLFIAFVISLTLPVTGILKTIFFPPEDVDYIYVSLETKQGTPVGTTDLSLRAIEEVLYEETYIKAFSSTAGSGSVFTGSSDSGGRYANITIELNKERELSSDEISAELREKFSVFKDAKVTIEEQQNGPPSGAPVLIKFIGDDLQMLADVTERAERILNSVEGTRDVTTTTDTSALEYVLTVDQAKASAAGVSPMAVAQTLRTAVYGTTATTYTESSNDIDVVVKLKVGAFSNDPAATPEVNYSTLSNLTVTNRDGAAVILGSILTPTIGVANAAISHENGSRVESVSAYVKDGMTALEVVNAFKDRESELELPAGVTVVYGGETEDINRSFTEMFLAIVAGIVLMLAILVLSFNSIRYSLYLLIAVPYSLIGVFAGLSLFGLPLSFTSMLGVIALSGVIINHSIILLDSMIHHKASSESASLSEQVAEAATSRLRPIFLTTITTVIGMIPLSHISDFWGPLAFAIMFGLAFAMVLTLIMVPVLFYRANAKE
ncbi:MAG: efflux RND transporter permease subunit [Candidatus Pacebacteria bacterium]|nr:efflux RND transporter permease subunit [Candidatus Paceibacterota bacterium]